MKTLIKNIFPGRYTSYPTVPYWNEADFAYQNWIDTLKSFTESNSKEASVFIYTYHFVRVCAPFVAVINESQNYKHLHRCVLKEWSLIVRFWAKTNNQRNSFRWRNTNIFLQKDLEDQYFFCYATKAKDYNLVSKDTQITLRTSTYKSWLRV
jgi:oxygen-independent coproporphyrinogen-3 oxidase